MSGKSRAHRGRGTGQEHSTAVKGWLRRAGAVAEALNRRSPSATASTLGIDICQMTGIVEQDKLGLEFGIRYSDEPDAEVRIPAAFSR